MKHVEKICWMKALYNPETLRRKIEINIPDDEKLRGALIRLVEYVAKTTSYFTETTAELVACETIDAQGKKAIDDHVELLKNNARELGERVCIYYKDGPIEVVELDA